MVHEWKQHQRALSRLRIDVEMVLAAQAQNLDGLGSPYPC
jgi:hypothetical protein